MRDAMPSTGARPMAAPFLRPCAEAVEISGATSLRGRVLACAEARIERGSGRILSFRGFWSGEDGPTADEQAAMILLGYAAANRTLEDLAITLPPGSWPRRLARDLIGALRAQLEQERGRHEA